MSTISPAAVKALRDRTNAPMMECKAALVEAGGDMEKAIDHLRTKLAGVIAKKADREAAEGRIAVFVDPAAQVGAILELRCESAPVAKTEQFVALANDIVKQIALKDPQSVEALLALPAGANPKQTISEQIGDVVGLIRENMKVAKFKRMTGLLGSYSHHDGSVGVLLQVEGEKADEQLLRDVCMHITARNPMAARVADVPAEQIAKEKDIAKEQVAADPKNSKKPANIIEMILEGKIKTWLGENVLEQQPFVKEESKTVAEVLKSAGLKVAKFVRLKVGEL